MRFIVSYLKALFALITKEILTNATELVDAIFDIVEIAIKWLENTIDEPVKIPFVSKALEYFGINSFSILDLVCFVPAFFANILFPEAKKMLGTNANTTLQSYTNINVCGKEMIKENGDAKKWDKLPSGYKLDNMTVEKLTLTESARSTKKLYKDLIAAVTLLNALRGSVTTLKSAASDIEIPWYDTIDAVTGIAFSILNYTFSFEYGKKQCPLSYDGSVGNKLVMDLWHTKFAMSLAKGLTDAIIAFVLEKEISDTKAKTASNISNVALILKGLVNLTSIGSEIAIMAIADKVDFKEVFDHKYLTDYIDKSTGKIDEKLMDKYKEEKDAYNEVFSKDRDIFRADNVGYVFDDISDIISIIYGVITVFVKTVDIRIVAAIAAGQLGIGIASMSANIAAGSFYEEYPEVLN